MNKGCSELLTVAEAVEARHGFSCAGRGVVQVAACGVGASFIKKDITPSRRASRRAFVKDRRTVSDKDGVKVIGRRVGEKIGKRVVFIVFADPFNAAFKSIT
jgi:hypothetical protein